MVAAVVHPEDVLVRDDGVPPVAAVGRGAVAGAPAVVDLKAAEGAVETRNTVVVPTAITLWPSDRAGRCTARAAAQRRRHRPQRDRVQHRDRRRLGPERGVAVLHHELAAVQDHERVVRALDGQLVRSQHVQLGAQPVRPLPEHHVQVAAPMSRHAAGPERTAREARRLRPPPPACPGPAAARPSTRRAWPVGR